MPQGRLRTSPTSALTSLCRSSAEHPGRLEPRVQCDCSAESFLGHLNGCGARGQALSPSAIEELHPWARRRGAAVEAVRLICAFVRANQIGTRAAIRVDPENDASVRVAYKCGFIYVRDFSLTTDTHDDGTPITLSLYLLPLLWTPCPLMPHCRAVSPTIPRSGYSKLQH